MRRRIALLALSLATALTISPDRTPAVGPDEDLGKELPRIKPLEPDEALRSFRIHKGFRLEPVAVEPLVADPVSVCYDADGRLYVAEMRGYPYPEKTPTGYIRRLEDRDGDGRFDATSIFVDGLSWPTSVVPYDGGVFIAVAPDILYAKDNDGDGKADVRKVVFSGFGTQNVQGLVNGLLWGTDGWIYGVSGGNGGDIRNLAHPDAATVSVRGRDFRFRPDGSAFEAISGGGQFGHSFDDWGHRFTCNNSNHIRQIVLPSRYLDRNPALVPPSVVDDIAAEGAAAPVFRISAPEPWRVVRTRQRAADPVLSKRLPRTELFATGFFTSATGVTIYRGTAFPTEYRGNAFVGDVGGNLVHRKVMSRHGAEFLATRADHDVEFLASTDNWFRPVNFTNTPDGTLLILDMYRETIEHPLSIPEPIKKHLDLTSGKDRGRLYNLVPDGYRKRPKPSLSNAKTDALVALLADPDAWWRETAQRLLIERRDPAALPLLKDLAQRRPTALGRVHALWTLDALAALTAADLLPALKDDDPNVREQAARLTEGRTRGNEPITDGLLDLAGDGDAMVRYQAALSLGDLDDSRVMPALARLARRDANDPWIRVAVMSGLKGRAVALIDRLQADSPGFLDEPAGRQWLEDVSALVGAENHGDELTALLTRFGEPGKGEKETVRLRTVLVGLARGLSRSGGSLRAVFRGPGGDRLAPIVAAARSSAQSNGPVRDRLESIRLIGLGPVDDAIEVLPGLLDARQPAPIQLGALHGLGALADPRVGPSVIAHWKALSPSVRREAIEVLFARREHLIALLDAIEKKAVSASDLDPVRRKQLLDHGDHSIRDRARTLLGGEPSADRKQVIAQFKKALELSGDRAKGRAVFLKVCGTCHKAEGQGTDVGPNLATVTGRSPEDLLIHILDPNREVAPLYVNYTVATTDGRVLTGLIAEESANAVTLKRAEGATDVIARDRIEAISSTGLSLMPEGLEKGLEPRDLADVIAYVRGIQGGSSPSGH